MSDAENINQPKTHKKWPYFVGGTIFVILVSLAIIYIPQYQAGLYKSQVSNTGELTKAERIQLEKDAVDFANKARATLAQILGGLSILGTIGVALWSAKIAQAAQTNAETAQKNLKLTEDTAQKNLAHLESSKITERFSKAIELLGNKDSLDVRLGAIYALERIARDSQPDHWTVMEVLTAFVREKSKDNEQEHQKKLEQTPSAEFKLAADIQAVLTVIGRRKRRTEETFDQRLDLREAYLPKANLSNGHFEKAILHNAYLVRAYLWKTHLEEAELWHSNLENAVLKDAHVEKTKFCGTELKGVILCGAYLKEADFYCPNFEPILPVKNLDWSQLKEANLNDKPILPPDFAAKWDEEKAKTTPDKTE